MSLLKCVLYRHKFLIQHLQISFCLPPLSLSSLPPQFAAGWWVMIDAAAVDNVENKHQAIGVMSTVGLFMVNAISAERINDSGIYTDGCLGGTGVSFTFFLLCHSP